MVDSLGCDLLIIKEAWFSKMACKSLGLLQETFILWLLIGLNSEEMLQI
jgi:hypothetical protein